MKRSKKIFLSAIIAFFIFLVWLMYDISQRTTFPGSRKSEKTPSGDTTRNHSSPKSTTQQP